jgi:AraC-like DNA-binding protein
VLEPDWALSLGARLHPATHGAVGIAAVSAPTLRDSLQVMARFSQLRSPHFRLQAHVTASEVRLVPEDRVALSAAERTALLDMVLLSTQSIIESIVGRPMREGRFELASASPEHASRYRDFLHAPVHFGCGQTAIVLPAAWLTLACPLAEPALFDASVQSLRDTGRYLQADRLLVARVEQLLAERGTRLGAQTSARLLGLSGRTLNRKLQREGTSYGALLEQHRRARAEALLRDPELSIGEIAYALGYRDPPNFGRAFRRWFELSPGEYRREFVERERR